MASSERIRRALAAAAELSKDEREELVAELMLSLEHEGPPDEGYDEAWSAEIRRRVDAVVSGRSVGRPWADVRRELTEALEQRRRGTA